MTRMESVTISIAEGRASIVVEQYLTAVVALGIWVECNFRGRSCCCWYKFCGRGLVSTGVVSGASVRSSFNSSTSSSPWNTESSNLGANRAELLLGWFSLNSKYLVCYMELYRRQAGRQLLLVGWDSNHLAFILLLVGCQPEHPWNMCSAFIPIVQLWLYPFGSFLFSPQIYCPNSDLIPRYHFFSVCYYLCYN